VRSFATAAALALALVGASDTLAVGDSISITILDAPRPQPRWGYAPSSSEISPGTWVTWSNNGQDAHTVTAADGSFDSGNLDPSEGFSWYFDQPGVYAYLCSLHPWMTGRVSVDDGVAQAPPPDDGSPSVSSVSQP
jgi:plastocyanin